PSLHMRPPRFHVPAPALLSLEYDARADQIEQVINQKQWLTCDSAFFFSFHLPLSLSFFLFHSLLQTSPIYLNTHPASLPLFLRGTRAHTHTHTPTQHTHQHTHTHPTPTHPHHHTPHTPHTHTHTQTRTQTRTHTHTHKQPLSSPQTGPSVPYLP